jgi:hypothetical protein
MKRSFNDENNPTLINHTNPRPKRDPSKPKPPYKRKLSKNQNENEEEKKKKKLENFKIDESKIPTLEDLKDTKMEFNIRRLFTLTRIPNFLLFVDLESLNSDALPLNDVLYWLLFEESITNLTSIYICKSQFIEISCSQCKTKLGKIPQSKDRAILSRMLQQPRHFSVLEYYTFLLYQSKLLNISEWYIVTANKERYERIVELGKDIRTRFIDIQNMDINSFPDSMIRVFNNREKYPKLKSLLSDVPMENALTSGLTLEENTLQLCVENVIKWISQMQKGSNPSHLPKTLSKFENAIKKYQCSYRYTITPEAIMQRLAKEGRIDSCDLCGLIYYPLKTPETQPLHQKTPQVLSDINEWVYEKTIYWINTQPNLPTTLSGLQNQIESTRLSHTIEANKVTQKLIDDKIITIADTKPKDNTDNPWASYTFYRSPDEEKITYSRVEDKQQENHNQDPEANNTEYSQDDSEEDMESILKT